MSIDVQSFINWKSALQHHYEFQLAMIMFMIYDHAITLGQEVSALDDRCSVVIITWAKRLVGRLVLVQKVGFVQSVVSNCKVPPLMMSVCGWLIDL